MKEWKKAIIAFGPLMLALWLVIAYFDNIITATFCIGVSIAVSSLVAGWIFFVFHILDDK